MLEQKQIDEFIDLTKESALLWLEDPKEDGERFFPPRIGVVHNDLVHIWVFPQGGGAGDVVNALGPIIQGMEPDAVLLAQDTLRVKHDAAGLRVEQIDGKPTAVKRDGTPWQRGEMQVAWKNRTEDAQDLTEAILVQYFDRVGNCVMSNLGYEIDPDGKVEWTDRMDLMHGVDGQMMGYLPETVRELFQRPTLSQAMAGMEDLENDLSEASELARLVMGPTEKITATEAMAYKNAHPEEAFAHQVCAVLKAALLPQKCAVMVGSSSEEINTIYRESLTEGKGSPMPEGVNAVLLHMSDHPFKDRLVRVHPFREHQRLVDGAVFRVSNWVDLMDPDVRMPWQQQADERPNWAIKGYVDRITGLAASLTTEEALADPAAAMEVMGRVGTLLASTEVVYGHVVTKADRHGLGYLVHVDELGEEVSDADLP